MAKAGFILSLIGAILIIIGGISILALGAAAGDFLAVNPAGAELGAEATELAASLQLLGAVGLIAGILVLVGAILLNKPGKETIGGILVIIFSLVSIVTGGGFLIDLFLIGLILGIIGGILGLAKK